jgi:alpha-galactosidase
MRKSTWCIVLILAAADAALGGALITGDPQNGSAQLAGASWVQYTFGNRFTVGEDDIEVTALGYYDCNAGGGTGDGLTNAHAVGIWDTSGNLLASKTVPAGTAGSLSNGYRYVSLDTPLVLSAGASFWLGGDTTTDTNDAFYLDRDTTDGGSCSFHSGVTLDYRCQSTKDIGFAPPTNDVLIATEAWLNANMLMNVRRVTGSGAPLQAELDTVAAWTSPWQAPPGSGGSAAPLDTRVPFAFNYGGVGTRATLSGWTETVTSVPSEIRGGTTHRHTYDDPDSGLRMTWDLTTFADYPAADWVLRFENTGTEAAPKVASVRALDFHFGPIAAGAQRLLRGMQGGASPHEDSFKHFAEDLSAGKADLEPVEGRSSDGTFPFFNLDTGGEGVIVALGWSGQWWLDAEETDSTTLRLRGGVVDQAITLQPGESFRSPRILLLYWTGKRLHGQNMFRRVLRDHYSLLLNGSRPDPVVQCNSWFPLGGGENATADLHVGYLQAFAGSGLEYLVMDAGWYSDRSTGSQWRHWVGSWYPNAGNFPEGLAPIGAAGQASGIRFGLWFEPERVYPGTDLANDHAGWLLQPPDIGAPGVQDAHREAYLLDLGQAEAQDWFVNTVSNFAADTPLGYFRHDYNHFAPLSTWRENVVTDRDGMLESGHVEGLYSVLDRLHEAFPGMVMEGCASGLRRIDLETFRRSHLYWKCDGVYADPETHQSQLWGGLHWLPGGFLNTQVMRLTANRYWLHSTYGGSLCVGWNPTLTTADPGHPFFTDAYDAELAADQIASFKAVRHLFEGDFFPLTAYTRAPDAWIGWQFHRDDVDEGMAVVFRRESATASTQTIAFDGVIDGHSYTLRTEGGTTVAGPVLGSVLLEGVQVSVPSAPGSILIHYAGEASEAGGTIFWVR